MLTLWVSVSRARAEGFTHKARLWGVIPGFWSLDDDAWLSRSDLFEPVEAILTWAACMGQRLAGREAQFWLKIGNEI